MKPGQLSERTQAIVRIVKEAGESGIKINAIHSKYCPDQDIKSFRAAVAQQAKRGLIFASKAKTMRLYFAKKEWADVCNTKPKKEQGWKEKSGDKMRSLCLDVVRFSGSCGILTKDIASKLDKNIKTVQCSMNWLRCRGEVFLCVNASPPRYFLTEEQAVAYMAQRGKIAQSYGTSRPKIEKPVKKTVSLVLVKREYEKSIKAPVIKWENQEAIIPAGVKITVRNAPPGRFEATGQYLYFSALQIGSYKPSDSAIARAYG